MPDLQAHSPAVGQKDGEKWTAADDLQPATPKSDSLLVALLGSGGLAEAVAETFDATAHVVHRFLRTGVKRM